MGKTVIEAAHLEPLAVKCFNCPTEILSFSEISEILSKRSKHQITVSDVKEFRAAFMVGNAVVPAPLIDKTMMMGIPQSLDDMFDHAMVDTRALRTGMMKEMFKVYADARIEKNNRDSISALSQMNRISDSIDTKMKQLSPTSDPASIVLGMDEFQKFKNVLWTLDRENPEWNLLAKYEAEIRKQETIDTDFTEEYEE